MLTMNFSHRTWSSPPGSKENTQQAGAGLYSHLDMDSVHDAILDVEGRLDLGDAYDNAFGIQTKALPQGYRLIYREQPVYSMEDEPWSGGKPFMMKFRDKSGLLKDRNLIELVQYIMQTRLRVANRIVQDEWEIDGRQLIRALYATDQPGKTISSFEDQMQRLPMAPTKMNKELVRTRMSWHQATRKDLHYIRLTRHDRSSTLESIQSLAGWKSTAKESIHEALDSIFDPGSTCSAYSSLHHGEFPPRDWSIAKSSSPHSQGHGGANAQRVH